MQNPHFQRGGPIYHTIIITGYDDSDGTFITNEPGTRYGKNYRYGQKLLFDAIRDWNKPEGLVDKKMMVVIR